MDESSGGGRFWLRSPGNNDKNAANVDGSGNVNDNGNNVNNDNVGIRPALSDSQVCFLCRSICDESRNTFVLPQTKELYSCSSSFLEQGKHWMVAYDYAYA